MSRNRSQRQREARKPSQRAAGGIERDRPATAGADAVELTLTPTGVPHRTPHRRGYGRRRAAMLILVYVLFTIHYLHWKLAGKTLAPLELNEVMHTLELGIVTAGFLFMCAAFVSTLVFGRFFCSWGCHILALQDLCVWLLGKLGLRRPKPVRSRLLLWVPVAALLYMFGWPQVQRVIEGRPPPVLHIATDAEGWASFLTTEFARNLPGPGVAIVTFLLCGFVIVYLLGSRSFCNYGCPYGVIFGWTDRFAPGRIRVTADCVQCGTCTATCTSGVRVHEEVNRHGMVVNPACMKDLDCVAACPHGALHYGFGKPSLFKSVRSGGRFGLPYDFSLREELLIAVVFVAVLLIFRGLYGLVPFLMTLGLGGIVGYLAVQVVRLRTRPNVRVATWTLKQQGRLSRAGLLYLLFFASLTAFVAHSAFIRYHEFRGSRFAAAVEDADTDRDRSRAARQAHSHLLAADRWGLFRNERVERNLVGVSLYLQRFADVETFARRVLRRHPDLIEARTRLAHALAIQGHAAPAEREYRSVLASAGAHDHVRAAAHHGLGSLLGSRGDFAGALRELERARELAPEQAATHAELGGMYAEMGRLEEAVASLREAVRLNPDLTRAHYNLGTLLAHLGRFDEAILTYERALDAGPPDAATLANLGFALLRVERTEQARERLEQALALDPNNADAHYNLGTLFAEQQNLHRAAEHLRAAARLDPRYARLLEQAGP